MPTKPTVIELNMNELEDVLRRAESALSEKDYALLKAVCESYAYLSDVVGDKNTTRSRLRKLLFGAKTEKTARSSAATIPPKTSGGRKRGSVAACLPRGSSRPPKAGGSRCSSAAASTPEKICRTR